MSETMDDRPGDQILHPCDRALLVLYGEDDGSSHAPETCGPCTRLLDQAGEVLGAYREHVPSSHAPADPPPDLREPSTELRAAVPRRTLRVRTFAAAAGLLLLAASGTIEGTRTEPAFALTDREIFWNLSFLYTDWDAVRSEPIWYEPASMHDIDEDLRDLARRLQLIDRFETLDRLEALESIDAVGRLDRGPPEPPEPSWDDLDPDAFHGTIETLNRQIDETRRNMEEWI